MSLAAALVVWRESRDAADADRVDALTTETLAPPKKSAEHHAWWMQHATRYDADKIGSLVATADVKLRERENARERLAAIATWPHDPRVATLLARWFVKMQVRWDPLDTGDMTLRFYRDIAAHLIALGDARVVRSIAPCVTSPPAPTIQLRTEQVVLAKQILDALPDAPAIEPTAAPSRDESTLWLEAAKQPAARAVLADLLVQRGDPRGELIALQLAHTPKADAQAKKLVTKHWTEWLGDLALVLNRKGTTFRDGMLDEVRVGTRESPDWAFAKVHGHRELASVRVVRPAHIWPVDYAQFLASPNLAPDIVCIDTPEMINALAYVRERWSIRVIEYSHQRVTGYHDSMRTQQALDKLSVIVPDLEELHIDASRYTLDLLEDMKQLKPRLQARLQRLQKLEINY